MLEKKYAEAVQVYRDFIDAEKCAVAPSLISKPWLRKSILSYQSYVDEPGIPYPVHRHETGEGYTNLGNAYFLMDRLKESEAAYLKALALEPGYEPARKNLGALYSKAQSKGALRKVPPPAKPPPPGAPPYTGFEVLPFGKK